jgi:predicted RNase H-like nuclease
MLLGKPVQIAGVDGCKCGRWIAVTASTEDIGKTEVKIFETAAALISEFAPHSIIAIDVPIGLPERATNGGREPDWAARAFLGPRRTSVFPVPSRNAVYAQDYAQLCVIARETSDPPKAPSIQLYGILPRIREIDEILRQDPAVRKRVYEVHPEVSFQLMNNNTPLPPKKVKGQISPPGIEYRKELLAKAGFALSFLDQTPPRGAGWDDFCDACACAWTAKRIFLRKAQVFPSIPPLDGEGLEQAIRA